MISDKKIAKEISLITLECREKLANTVDNVKANCTQAELEAYQKAIGYVLGNLIIRIMEPIYEQHPDLKPDNLK